MRRKHALPPARSSSETARVPCRVRACRSAGAERVPYCLINARSYARASSSVLNDPNVLLALAESCKYTAPHLFLPSLPDAAEQGLAPCGALKV
jgi:hypothetical protein